MSNCLVLWCSGYHICFTRRRSPVRSRAGSVKLFCIPSISIQCYNANIYFHRRLHCVHCDIKSKPDCNWLTLTLRTKCHLIWTCLWWYTHFTLQWPISVGDVAQMVERSLSMWEVGGSIPPVSKLILGIFFKKIASSGNRTRAARVAGEHSTTEPTMPHSFAA